MSWKSKKCVVTGGAGFIGSNLTLHLLQAGAQVTVIDNFSPYCGANPANLPGAEKNLTLLRLDLTQGDLSSAIGNADFVFHLAGQIGHNFSHKHPQIDLEINTLGSLRVLEEIRKSNPKVRTLFTSTRQIYGEPQYNPVDEKHPLHPLDLNGVHKLAAEQYFSLYHKVYGVPTTSLRLTNTYGPRQSIRNNQLGVVGWFLNRALLDKELPLVDGGAQKRDFSYVDDICRALIMAAECEATIGGIYNLSGERSTLKGLAETLISVAGSGRLASMDMRTEERNITLKDYFGSSELFQKVTGWKPQFGLRQGLAQSIEYFRPHLESYVEGATT